MNIRYRVALSQSGRDGASKRLARPGIPCHICKIVTNATETLQKTVAAAFPPAAFPPKVTIESGHRTSIVNCQGELIMWMRGRKP